MTFGFFCFFCAIAGWLGMMVFALAEYFNNNVRAKVFCKTAKEVAIGLGIFGTFFIALAVFG